MLYCPVVWDWAKRQYEESSKKGEGRVSLIENDKDREWWREHRQICLLCYGQDVERFVQKGIGLGLTRGEAEWLKWHLLRLLLPEGRRILGALQRAADDELKAIAARMYEKRNAQF